jgi:hypothetical protein
MVLLNCLIDIEGGQPYCLIHKQDLEICKGVQRRQEAEEMKVFKEKELSSQQPPTQLPRNPHYLKLIEKIKAVHESKSHDYAKDTNVFSNFEFAAKVAEIFTDPVDKVFATLIGIKLARLAELRSGKKPKNEPLMDTLEDMTNYSAIWGSRIMKELEELDGRDNL